MEPWSRRGRRHGPAHRPGARAPAAAPLGGTGSPARPATAFFKAHRGPCRRRPVERRAAPCERGARRRRGPRAIRPEREEYSRSRRFRRVVFGRGSGRGLGISPAGLASDSGSTAVEQRLKRWSLELMAAAPRLNSGAATARRARAHPRQPPAARSSFTSGPGPAIRRRTRELIGLSKRRARRAPQRGELRGCTEATSHHIIHSEVEHSRQVASAHAAAPRGGRCGPEGPEVETECGILVPDGGSTLRRGDAPRSRRREWWQALAHRRDSERPGSLGGDVLGSRRDSMARRSRRGRADRSFESE